MITRRMWNWLVKQCELATYQRNAIKSCDYLASKSVIKNFIVSMECDDALIEAEFQYHGEWFRVIFDYTLNSTGNYWDNKFTLERLS